MEVYEYYTDNCAKVEGNIMLTDVDKEVILAYADCNMNTYDTARKIYLHRNTVDHHLTKVKKVTGLDPRNFYDLHKLVEFFRSEQKEKE